MYDDDDKDQVLGGGASDDVDEEDDSGGDGLTPKKSVVDPDLDDDLDDDDLEKPVAKDEDDELPSGFHAIEDEE